MGFMARLVHPPALSLVPTCTAVRWAIAWQREIRRIPTTIGTMPRTMSSRLGARWGHSGKRAKILALSIVLTLTAPRPVTVWQLPFRLTEVMTIRLMTTSELCGAKTVGMEQIAPRVAREIAR